MQRELDSFDQGSGGSPVLAAEGTGWLDPATGDVLLAVAGELAGMASLLGRASARRRIGEIQAMSRGLLHRIAQLLSSSQINPWTRIRLSPTDPPLHPSANAVRLGVFPTTANPLHWGHLLSALAVMAELGLDRVAFIIARDPASNGDLFPEEIRRGAAVEALQHFQPFFTLAPASAGRTASGPEALSRVLALNPSQMIETAYITDGESGKLTPEAGETLFGDLVHEVGAKGAGYDDRLHPLTVALLVADAAEQGPSPHPRVRVISSPLPGASSAGIRAALRDPVRRDDLAALPASSFRHLRVLSGLD